VSGPTWLGFLLASFLISISPGPGAVASMSSGARSGFPAGYWTAVGLQGGLIAQIALVACGVGALLATSEPAFLTVQWLGALYLAWLGLRLCLGGSGRAETVSVVADRPGAQMLRGLLVNLSNPKAIVFLLAVLPQFLDLGRPLWPQYAVMAATMVSVDLAVMAVYTGLGASLLKWFADRRHRRLLDVGFGVLFVGAAVVLVLHRR
jgi:homoserine/homoserine lactone efflux protein